MSGVLITGSKGFLGRQICSLAISQGTEIWGTGTQDNPAQNYTKCDLTNFEDVRHMLATRQPDAIIHCAAISSVTSNPWLDYYQVNVGATQNILRAIEELKKRTRLIFISTAGVYGNLNAEVYTEDMAPRPVHHYGLSKFVAERLLYNFADHVDFTIVRPFNIIGTGQTPGFIVPKLLNAFAEGQRKIRLGNLDVYRDYIDVEAAASIILVLLSKEVSFGEVVNLCSGRATSLRELIAAFEDIFGHKIEIEVAEEFVRKNEVWRLIGSHAKLERLFPEGIFQRPLQLVLNGIAEHHCIKRDAAS